MSVKLTRRITQNYTVYWTVELYCLWWTVDTAYYCTMLFSQCLIKEESQVSCSPILGYLLWLLSISGHDPSQCIRNRISANS